MCSNCGCDNLSQAAESISDLKIKKDSCCCGATKKTPCICMILGSQCSSVKPMCPCYRLLSVQTKDEKNAETFEARDTSWCVNHGWIQGSKVGDIIPCLNCDNMNCGGCRCGGCGNCMTSDCCECKNAETFDDMKINYDNRDRIFFIKSVDYDTDGEIENDELPQEFTIKIPSDYHYFDEDADEGDITDVLNEWISTETGFSTKGIVWIEEENNSWRKNAETFESAVVANKVPKTPVQKAMLNRAMMEKAEIEHTILDLETKARLGLLDEKALMESLAKKFGAEGAEEIATYYQNFKEKHPKLHETFVLRVADEDWWYGKSRKNMEEKLDKLGFDFDIVNDYWETVGYDLNPIYETCTDCEGEGIIITNYYPATRDDPADADYETCEMCEGKGKVLDNPLFESENWGDENWCEDCGTWGESCDCPVSLAENFEFDAETKKRKTGFRKCSKCGYSDHNSTNCNRLDEYEAYRKHKDEMLKECDDAIQRFTRSAKRYSEDGEYGLAKMLRSDATDMKKLKRMIEKNHFGKAVHFAMSMDSDPREMAPSALWMFESENEEGSKAFIVAGIAVLSALSFGIYRRLTK